jgi:VCBS repeat-containing protein
MTKFVRIKGTNYAETIYGTDFNDKIKAKGGDDVVFGFGGNDRINGGSGNDTIFAGLGNDSIDGGKGIDAAVFSGTFDSYSLSFGSSGSLRGTVVGADGIDQLKHVEFLEFDDAIYDVRNDTVFFLNRPPTASDDGAAASEDGLPNPVSGNVLANDTDTDPGTVLTVSTPGAFLGTYGTLVLNVDGSYGYTLANGQNNVQMLHQGQFVVDTFDYTATDGLESDHATLTVTITGTNDAPTTTPVTLAAIAEDSTARLITQAELLANASDVDNPSLSAINLAISSGNGSLADNGDGTWTYTPTLNDDTSVAFSYAVTDGLAPVATSATLDITPVNDAPETAPVQLAAVAEDSGARLITQAELLANAADIDGPGLSVVNLAKTSGNGSLLDNGDGTWSYTPAQDDDTAVTFSYDVTDGIAPVATSATLDITPVNDAPMATPQTLATGEDVPVAGTLAAIDIDDGDVDFALVGPALGGEVTTFDAETGAFTFTPTADFSGTASFKFTATDGIASSTVQTVTINVDPVADAPALLTFDAEGFVDTAIPLNLWAALHDRDGSETLSIEIAGVPAGATLSAGTNNGGGIWTLTPEQLSGLSITPPPGSDADFTLTVTATSTELGNGDTALVADGFSVAVAPAHGSSFQINTYTAGHQLPVSDGITATLVDGTIVVVWESENQDGSGLGVFGQRISVDGNKIGGEFQINAFSSGDQRGARVTALDDGGFLVTWNSQGQDGGSGTGVFAQRYNAATQKVGAEFLVHDYVDGAQEFGVPVTLNNGQILVVWQSFLQDGSGNGVYGRIFDASGAAATGELLINGTTAGNQSHAKVAAFEDGGFVVVWKSGDGGNPVIMARLFDEAGSPRGSEFRIDTAAATARDNPSVAVLADGGFIVTWDAHGVDGSGSSARARRYDADGDPVGAEFQLSTFTAGDQFGGNGVALQDGSFLMAWTSVGQDGVGGGVFGQRFAADGSRVGAEFQITPNDPYYQGINELQTLPNGHVLTVYSSYGQDGSGGGVFGTVLPVEEVPSPPTIDDQIQINTFSVGNQLPVSGGVAATLLDNTIVVVWNSDGQDGSGLGVFGQRIDADGSKIGGEFQINAFTSNDQRSARVTALDDGGFLVTWQSQGQDGGSGAPFTPTGVIAQRYDAAAQKVGSEFVVHTYVDSSQEEGSPNTLVDGRLVITWHSYGQDGSGTGVFGRVFNPDGTSPMAEFRINETTAGNQHAVRSASLADGGFVVVWKSQTGSAYSIMARRFDAEGNPVEAEHRVDTAAAADRDGPSVLALPDGGYVVSWGTAGSVDGSGGSGRARQFDAGGNPTGPEFQVNTFTPGEQGSPEATVLGDGGYLMAWSSDSQDGSGKGVYGQRFAADGSRIGGEFRISPIDPYSQDVSDLHTLPDGRVLAIYRSDGADGSGGGVFGRFVTFDDLVVPPPEPEPVSSMPLQLAAFSRAAYVAADGDLEPEGVYAALDGGGYGIDWTFLDHLGAFEVSPVGAAFTGLYVNGENANASALVAEGTVEGERSLVIAYTGTNDGLQDVQEYDIGTFSLHYQHFQGFNSAVVSFVQASMADADPANDILRVYLTGHSLGGAMVERFMVDHDDALFAGMTFGAPGLLLGLAEPNDPRILNFQHVGDPVVNLGGFTLVDGGEAVSLQRSDLPLVGLDRHAMTNYLGSMTILEQANLPGLTDGYETVDGRRVVVGTAGDDYLESSSILGVNEVIVGGAGDDILVGAQGDDLLLGGSGNDVFAFEDRLFENDGADTIADFLAGIGVGDIVLLQDFGWSNFAQVLAATDDNTDGNAVVQLPDGASITILDVPTAHLAPDDFAFA